MAHSRRAGWLAAGLLLLPPVLLSAGRGSGPGVEAASPRPSEIRFRVSGLRSDGGRLACGPFVEENWLRPGVADAG